MRIPKDLRPGDIGVCRDGTHAVYSGVYHGIFRDTHPFLFQVKHGKHGISFSARLDGRISASGSDGPWDIIRIERKPTVLQRQLAVAKDHLRRKMEGKPGEAKRDREMLADIFALLQDLHNEPRQKHKARPLRHANWLRVGTMLERVAAAKRLEDKS